jgi:aflatoxin B1 aldehyde reductase
MAGLKIVYGGAGINPGTNFPDAESLKPVFDTLEKHDVRVIDTAHLYGESERILGEAGAGKSFIVDTKWKGGFETGSLSPERIRKDAQESLQKLGVKQIDIFYIHAPDSTAKPQDFLPVIDELHKEGVFKRFGLSNFLPEQVQEIHDAVKKGGWVLPTAYQGNYNPVARKQDTELFPVLRKLGISFYAYSPLAGGFLTKTKQQITEGAGRFDASKPVGQIYLGLYSKPAYLEALGEWERIAKEEGVSRAELAYRWVSYHSPLKPEQGDAIIVGASSVKQLEETLEGLERGPLSDKAAKAIDGVWEMVKHEAPLDNFNSYVSLHWK